MPAKNSASAEKRLQHQADRMDCTTVARLHVQIAQILAGLSEAGTHPPEHMEQILHHTTTAKQWTERAEQIVVSKWEMRDEPLPF